MWLSVARSLKTQRGYLMYKCSAGDLKLIVNELTAEGLSAEDSGETKRYRKEHMKKAVA